MDDHTRGAAWRGARGQLSWEELRAVIGYVTRCAIVLELVHRDLDLPAYSACLSCLCHNAMHKLQVRSTQCPSLIGFAICGGIVLYCLHASSSISALCSHSHPTLAGHDFMLMSLPSAQAVGGLLPPAGFLFFLLFLATQSTPDFSQRFCRSQVHIVNLT